MPGKEIQWIFLNVIGSFKNLQNDPIVIYYTLYNNFFYTQLASFLVPQKDSYYVHDGTEAFFLFFLHLFFFRNILIFFG